MIMTNKSRYLARFRSGNFAYLKPSRNKQNNKGVQWASRQDSVKYLFKRVGVNSAPAGAMGLSRIIIKPSYTNFLKPRKKDKNASSY